VLYRHAEAILRHVEFAKQDAMRALNVPSGRVSIGFPLVLAALLSYETFARVRSAFPQIVLHITDASYAVVREQLINGRLDMALLFVEQPESALTIEPLLYEELVCVTAKPNTLPITLADAAQQPLLAAGPNSNCRRVAQEAFKKRGLDVTWISEIDTLSALRQAVACGIGDSIMSWSALYGYDGKIPLHYRSFADEKLKRPVALCFSEVGQRSPAIEAVAQVLKSLVYELIENGKWPSATIIAPQTERSPATAYFSASVLDDSPKPNDRSFGKGLVH
jgi:LysR family nitrogen assimilation transcriptional regulator